MKAIHRSYSVIMAACFAVPGVCAGQTWLTIGAGSAVSVSDRSTTFDALDYNGRGTALSDYSVAGLNVFTNGDSYYGEGPGGFIPSAGAYFNPFHLTDNTPGAYSYAGFGGGFYFPSDGEFGNYDWITISASDARTIYAIEFLYGNGWTTGDIYGPYPWGTSAATLEWETYVGAQLADSGQQTGLSVGTVVGFFNPTGFDRLRVRARANSIDPNLQELAIDNLSAQITPPVTCPADFNSDGVLNADDLADFITGYFNSPPDPRADFNQDGVINADDLGDFITAYFNGC